MKREYDHGGHLGPQWRVIDDAGRVYYVAADRSWIESAHHGPISLHGRTGKRILAALPSAPDELSARRRKRGQ